MVDLGRVTLSRRALLRRTALVSGWLTLSRLQLAPRAAAAATPGELKVLSPAQAALLTAIGDRMTFTGDPSMPAFRDTAAIHTIDQALRYTDAEARKQIGWLLSLFEWGPPIF